MAEAKWIANTASALEFTSDLSFRLKILTKVHF